MTKKNDGASGTKASVRRPTGMKSGKKPKTLNQSTEVRGGSSQSGRRVPRLGEAREEPGPASRGRLLARMTGAVTTGVQLIPDTEGLHSGLLLAALVLLSIDVLIDVGMSVIGVSGRLWRVLRTLWASMKRDPDGNIFATVQVEAPSVRRGNGLRITGRVVSSLLIVGSTVINGWQHELLVAALTTLVVDVISESFALLSGYLRTRQG